MRELKPRCWHKIEKRFVDLRNIDFETETIGYDSQGEFNRYESEKFENVVFQQFTCLRDKNGADIYEGDIIENENFIGVMEFHNGSFCLVEKKAKIPFITTNDINTFTHRKIGVIWYDTIIGNINENPDLLK